jgi:MSHA biogenesis protein MshE
MSTPIPAALVKQLRDRTGAGMMECKAALQEANGDLEEAATVLRKRGLAQASKKAGRTTSEGLVGTYIHLGGRIGVLLELNCESDFVAKTDDFQNLLKEIGMQIAAANPQYVTREQVPPKMLERFREIIQRTAGMVLVTGPTGSGKTTTLYAALSEVNTPERKIVTVEDPVEYRLAGINQVQVNEKIDLSFARVLRSTLRQDPDVILVGEIRDEETAQIALRAALTGHLVFSTLHTKDAVSTPIRLIDMGAPSYMVATSVHAVIAQRLLRLNCESCNEEYQPDAHESRWLAAEVGADFAGRKYFRGRGCSHCNGSGFAGRIGVYEMLEMTPDLSRAAVSPDPNVFMEAARPYMKGVRLTDQALALVLKGRTTGAEALKVATQVDD